MPRSQKNKHNSGKPPVRPLVRSLDIPPSQFYSKQPSCITIRSSATSSRQESPQSENLSAATSYTELYCTPQTCTDSQNCIKTCQQFCSHGLKELKNAESQCSETCSHNIKVSSNKAVQMPTDHRSKPKDKDESKRPNSNHPPAVPIQTVKSAGLPEKTAACCSKPTCGLPSPPAATTEISPTENQTPEDQNDTTPSHLHSETELPGGAQTPDEEPLENAPSSGRKMSVWAATPDQEQFEDAPPTGRKMSCWAETPDQERFEDAPPTGRKMSCWAEAPDQEQIENTPSSDRKMSCCAESDKLIQTRDFNFEKVDDEVNPDTEPVLTSAAATEMTEISASMNHLLSASSAENSRTDLSPSALPAEEINAIISPESKPSSADIRRKSCIHTSFRLPEAETESLGKHQPVNVTKAHLGNDTKCERGPCVGAGILAPPPIQKKCSCHFPPAFNQFGCTGNISGNCNCTSDD